MVFCFSDHDDGAPQVYVVFVLVLCEARALVPPVALSREEQQRRERCLRELYAQQVVAAEEIGVFALSSPTRATRNREKGEGDVRTADQVFIAPDQDVDIADAGIFGFERRRADGARTARPDSGSQWVRQDVVIENHPRVVCRKP